MRRGVRRALLLPLAFAACAAPQPAAMPPQPRYVVGAPYEAGGTWFYPREDLRYDQTGLAAVVTTGSGLTANGERADPTALVAAHPTLQLPAIVRVTALQTGRQIRVRVNDRGPANPGRIIALSPRAAELLGLPAGEAARVRVQVEPAESERLREQLGGGPALELAAAPREAIHREPLAPPPGMAASGRRALPGPSEATPELVDTGPPVPLRLPETVRQVPPAPGQLWLRAGRFGRMDYAARRRAQLSPLPVRIDREREGRAELYRLRAGPFATVAQADSALDDARRAGVTDARITVE